MRSNLNTLKPINLFNRWYLHKKNKTFVSSITPNNRISITYNRLFSNNRRDKNKNCIQFTSSIDLIVITSISHKVMEIINACIIKFATVHKSPGNNSMHYPCGLHRYIKTNKKQVFTLFFIYIFLKVMILMSFGSFDRVFHCCYWESWPINKIPLS